MSQGKVGQPPTSLQNPKHGRRCLTPPEEARDFLGTPLLSRRTPIPAGTRGPQAALVFLFLGHPPALSLHTYARELPLTLDNSRSQTLARPVPGCAPRTWEEHRPPRVDALADCLEFIAWSVVTADTRPPLRYV